jgi:hypothetical protein
MQTHKDCTKCKETKAVEDYQWTTKRGVRYRRSDCKTCHNLQRAAGGYAKRSAKLKEERASGARREYFIHIDSKGSDKKNGREYGLSEDMIRGLLSKECSHCGEEEGQMTLDRIDNDIGHVPENVVTSCYRCNMVRGSMPIEAWELFKPVMRAAREKGLFGSWASKPLRRRRDNGGGSSVG